ncbi:type III secretion system stalk subunit SctO [Brucella sp. IR073]|uniref:type III secretion system stalk subunit SctO n=1 Tax=unclassified Brucella TaxID=2632610 RepID=UPI003B986D8F
MIDLERIVGIRSRRLNRARQKLAEARAEFSRAGSQVVTAQQAVDDFDLATRSLEIELLTSILNKPTSIQTLLMIEEELKKTEKQAKELAQRLVDAKEVLNTAGEAAETAARGTASVERQLTKSQYLLDEAHSAELSKADRCDESELEDFASSRNTGLFYHGY